ncbi:ABC transporter ATP-binding protein [uncultured Eubacterium sp.]|uniref:ABC transporter ATP-binding protein n=1 Tax=uncultured Eubacterium sp. TaxID=165185 RepID=UPI00259AA47D|nr:ABC transporter ATP-binding protein [uncultured Eubacterium sp.]
MLCINGIAKSFGDHCVLKDVSFSVGKGEIYGLIGENGAGKTTLMNIISGLSAADAGSFFAGKEDHPLKRVGYLPDIPSFFDYLSTKEYIDFLLMNTRKTNTKRDQLLTLVGLKGNERIRIMSRGMKQRLGIAAALVTNPDVLLLDEPTSALDPMGRHELMEIMKQLREDGKTIILSTHILADMERVCDKVGFLHNGSIQREVRINDLLSGRDDTWEITFDCELSDVPQDSAIVISKVGQAKYTFQSNDQKRLLFYLSQLPETIVSIKNKATTLDDLFEEVCQ